MVFPARINWPLRRIGPQATGRILGTKTYSPHANSTKSNGSPQKHPSGCSNFWESHGKQWAQKPSYKFEIYENFIMKRKKINEDKVQIKWVINVSNEHVALAEQHLSR